MPSRPPSSTPAPSVEHCSSTLPNPVSNATSHPLRILTINCGGIGNKFPRLLAVLLHSDPDVLCLQEAGSLPPESLAHLPFQSWQSHPIRGGGLMTLLHIRRLQPSPPKPNFQAQDHALLVSVKISDGFCLTVANLHLPPSLPPQQRRVICVHAASSLNAAPAGAKIICGDLNDTQCPGDSQWLCRTLAPHGPWWGYHSPYKPGVPTNYVNTTAGTSAREIDWILISADTPCTKCDRVLLPGISTHLCLQCDITIPVAAFGPADPTGRQFRFHHASENHHQAAGVAVALALWWAQARGLALDPTIHCCWDQGGAKRTTKGGRNDLVQTPG